MGRRRKVVAEGAQAAPQVEPTPETKRGRGRPPREKPPVELPVALGDNVVVRPIPLSAIDLEDTRYRFRANIRVGDLKKSIEKEGQQIPAVVRRKPGGSYQLISGFRRATALKELGARTIAAYVRDDLQDDEAAFRASVLENMARKSYSDIDRAYVIKRYEEEGYQSFEVAELMNLSKRQKNNLLSLLELPESVQQALEEPDANFTTTHALTLKKLKKKYPNLNYGTWIKRVNQENLSVSQLIRAVNEAHKDKAAAPGFKSLFRNDGTDFDLGHVRLRPVKFNVHQLSTGERETLRDELSRVLTLLDQVPAE